MIKRKNHFFKDCDANIVFGTFSLEKGDYEHGPTVALPYTTCGRCKGRVLEAIREADWSKLDFDTSMVLLRWAEKPNLPKR